VFGWNGLLAPAGTPGSIIASYRANRPALQNSELRERIASLGFEPVGNTPEEFGEFSRRHRALGGRGESKAARASIDRRLSKSAA